MAPKKKGGKRADDDWEAEALGEAAETLSSNTLDEHTKDTVTSSGQDDATGSGGGGGLLAALKKNKQSKKQKGKVSAQDESDVKDSVDGAIPNGTSAQTTDIVDPQASNEVNADEVSSTQDSKGKPAKVKEGKRATSALDDAEASANDMGGLKSRKEKEKEKREREKQRKKEQAAKKKTPAASDPIPKVEPEVKASTEEPKPPSNVASDASKGKAKKLPAHLAAIQKQQEALRQQREAQEKADADEKARLEAAERQAVEEEQKKEEARTRKKEKEKAKREQLKKEGKLLTPAQREQQRRDGMKRQQMIAAGMRVAGMDEEAVEKKRPVYDSKRRKAPKKTDVKHDTDQKPQEEPAPITEEEDREADLEAETAPAAGLLGQSESDELDDWEKAAEADEISAQSTRDTVTEGLSRSSSIANEEHPDSSSKSQKSGLSNRSTHGRHPVTSLSRSGSESGSESDAAPVNTTAARAAAQKKAEVAAKRKHEHEQALAARSKDNLRSPICCILGHVDTGKTKLLDKVRQTNVQEGEAGGITQQIGATYFPVDALKTKTEVVNKDGKFEFKVPGLLVIDTPGHESFTNLRSRGSSLCNIAILVVDIMHGLEPQTLESMRLLRDRKTPFIVALNKIDRLYGWKKVDNNGFLDSISKQNKGVQGEFRDRLERTKLAFSEQGFNAELFSENKSMARNVSLVPTSAHTGEGVPDLLKLLVSLTQERMTNQLMYLSEVECTVLEVKVIEGLGTTIDVVLSNGVLHEGDQIVLCGLEGAISTKIRALLTPAPLKELRLKSQYVHNQQCKAALGVKITANNLDNAIAGSRLLVVRDPEEVEDLEEEVMSDIENLLSRVTKTGRGVSVQASTLGSLEALLEFLKVSKIPVANISIGPVFKRDVMTAGIMLEKSPEYAVMLCFDVKVDKEAQTYADEHGIKIFTADIIYHLFDDFTRHMAQLAEQKKEENKHLAVFPCVLQPIAVFMKKDPILVGADVTEGNLKLHTPIAAVKTNPITGVKEIVSVGRVTSIEREHKTIPNAKKGSPSVAVKIEGPNQPLYGRHLEEKDTLYSLISRQSIDTLKDLYRSEVSNDEWLLIKKLKPLFDVA